MEFATGFDPFLRAAFWVGIAAVVLAVVLVVAVFGLRVRLLVERRRERRLVARWRPLLTRCVAELPDEIPQLARADRYAALKLWNYYHESLLGSARERLVTLAQRAGMQGIARDLLARGNLRQRLIAITTLGHMGAAEALPVLAPLAHERDPVLSFVAVRALLLIDPERELPAVLPQIAQRAEWPLAKVAALLAEIGADRITAPLVDATRRIAAESHDAPRVARIVRLLAVGHLQQAQAALIEILEAAENPEVLAACLGALQDARGLAAARRHAAHPAWYVRVAAARALGRLGAREDVATLTALLGDPSWWVRYRAAQALVALPFLTEADIRQVRSGHADRFAADILDQVLAEGAAA